MFPLSPIRKFSRDLPPSAPVPAAGDLEKQGICPGGRVDGALFSILRKVRVGCCFLLFAALFSLILILASFAINGTRCENENPKIRSLLAENEALRSLLARLQTLGSQA